jgi:hypothetical protein
MDTGHVASLAIRLDAPAHSHALAGQLRPVVRVPEAGTKNCCDIGRRHGYIHRSMVITCSALFNEVGSSIECEIKHEKTSNSQLDKHTRNYCHKQRWLWCCSLCRVFTCKEIKMRLNKYFISIFLIIICLLFLFMEPCCKSRDVESSMTTVPIIFTKIEAPLTLDGTEPGTHIPRGSTIYHWANGITEVIGLEGERIFVAKDSEAAMLPHPSGPKGPFESPATFILQLPSGSAISEDKDNKGVTRVFLSSELILTIITKSEDFQW